MFDKYLIAEKCLPLMLKYINENDSKVQDHMVKHSGEILFAVGIDIIKEKC